MSNAYDEEIDRLLSELVKNNNGKIDNTVLLRMILSLDKRVEKLEEKVAVLLSQNNLVLNILKYVVVPLIAVVGALAGVKIVAPEG